MITRDHSDRLRTIAPKIWRSWVAALSFSLKLWLVAGSCTAAQENGAVPGIDAPSPGIALNFPENMEIKTLVQYVSQRLEINILYDEQVGNRRVTIKAPQQVPESSLLGLLESALKMKGLALVDSDEPGWKRIVPGANLIAIARSPQDTDQLLESPDAPPTLAVTRVFTLEHADPKRAEAAIKPFLTQPGANSLALDGQPLLIITDYVSNMSRIAELIHLIDQPGTAVTIRYIQAQFQEASELAQEAQKTMRAKMNAEMRASGATQPTEGLVILHHERTNQVVIVGVEDRVLEAIGVIEALDVSLNLTTRVYQFQIASPERVDTLTQELIGPLAAKRMYRSAVDQDGGILVVTATEEIHQRIESLKVDLDVPAPESQSPIRVYKLANATASDVLDTIRALESDEGLYGQIDMEDSRGGRSYNNPPSAANQPPAPPGQQPPAPPIYQPSGQPADGSDVPGAIRPVDAVRSDRATVTADVNTNSIIVVASPEVQSVYERLIRMLDRRRPQVLIEITIATINTTDNFDFGVEISRATDADDATVLTFSSFGLSTVDAVTGGLTLLPGTGFNGAVIDSQVADIVIKALQKDTRTNVVSAPKILVNDNATGTLTSIAEEPFTSINASDTVSTTSFGGFVEAGTTISVIPHISEGDYLSLEYSISLNSFRGSSSAEGIPPPRQTDSVESEVTVPDGRTIIVGGLTRTTFNETINSVPLLGEIPILKHLFSNQDIDESQSTLFVFLRPVILRDDQFEDLKFLSEQHLGLAELPGDYPTSEPLIMR